MRRAQRVRAYGGGAPRGGGPSGTHTDRHVAPEITGLLAWPDPERAVLRDWAGPGSEEAGPKKQKAKVSLAIVSHAATYHHNATEEHTLFSRGSA